MLQRYFWSHSLLNIFNFPLFFRRNEEVTKLIFHLALRIRHRALEYFLYSTWLTNLCKEILSFQTSLQSMLLSSGSPFGKESDSAKINMLWFLLIPINQLPSGNTADKQILIFSLNYHLCTFRKTSGPL